MGLYFDTFGNNMYYYNTYFNYMMFTHTNSFYRLGRQYNLRIPNLATMTANTNAHCRGKCWEYIIDSKHDMYDVQKFTEEVKMCFTYFKGELGCFPDLKLPQWQEK